MTTTPNNFELYVDGSQDGLVLDGTSTDLLSMNIPASQTGGAVPLLHSSGTYTGASPGSSQAETINLAVSTGDIVVIVADFYTSNPSTAADFKVNSIAGGGVSGSWTQRFAQNQASTEYSGKSLRKEVWWGVATSAATSVAVTLSAVTTTYVSVTAFSVSGANTTTPFDPNSALPAYSAVGSGSNSYYHKVSSVSTNNSNNSTLVFAAICQVQSSSTPTQLYQDQHSLTGDVGSPTLISNNPASSYMASAVECQTSYQALSGATVNVFGDQTAYDYIAYVDAIQAAQLGSTGTWATTEGTDTFACYGGLLQGSWHSTDGTDVCSMHGGILGGSWHSTEGTDVWTCSAKGVGGRWISTDGTDVFACTGQGPNQGTWASTDGTDIWTCSAKGVGGKWISTEGTDVWGESTFFDPYGPWHSTETADHWAAAGYPQLTGEWGSTDGTDICLFKENPSGPWHSTEAKDTMAVTGSTLGGSWHSTEAADKTGGSTVFGDGWLGWVPVSFTIGLTGTKDTFGARGYLQQPFLDGAAATGHGGGPGLGTTVTSVSCTLSTLNPNDVIVVAVINSGFFSESTSPSTITDTAGLVWNNRLAYNTLDHSYYEVWWAHAPAVLTGDVITATLASKTESASIMAFGVQGANFITPFDTHSGLPVNNWYSAGTSQTANISTVSPNDMLLAISFIRGTLSQVSTISTINQDVIGSVENDGYYYGASILAQGKTVAVTETNLGVTISGSSMQNVGLYLDAIVGWPTGTWVDTEHKDTMAATGSTLGGSWHSTDHKDTFGGSPELSPYDDIGWIGWVKSTGTWASTEHADVMTFSGDLPPNGTWHSTEGTDFWTVTGETVPPLSLDGYANSGVDTNGATSSTVTLSTTKRFDVIVLCVVTGGFWNHGYVTGVTDTAGLTWKKRNQRWSNGGVPSLEIWWAPAPDVLTGDVITVTTTPTGAVSTTAFAVNGSNYLAPWDTHTMAGWMYDNAQSGSLGGGTPPTGTCPVSTLAKDTFCFAFGNTALAAFTPPYGSMFDVNNSLNMVLSGNTNLGAIGDPWLWTATGTSSPGGVITTYPKTAGKYYCEFSSGNDFPLTGSEAAFGVCTTTANLATLSNGIGGIAIHPDGSIWYNGSYTGITLGAIVNTSVIGIAFDMDNLRAWFALDNGNWNGSGTANPATNTGGIDVSAVFSGKAATPFFATNSTADSISVNLGSQTFAYYGGLGEPSGITGFSFGWPGGVIGTPLFGNETNGYSYVCGVSHNINSEPQGGYVGGSYVTNYAGENIFGIATTDFLIDAIVGGAASPDASTANQVPFYFDGESSGSTIQTFGSANPTINLQPTVDDYDQMYVCAFLISSAGGAGTILAMTGGITGSPGWERRSRTTDATGKLALEVWWGYSSVPTSGVIACATNNIAAGDTICTVFYSVGGTTHSLASTYELWDGDVSLPALSHSNSGGYPNVTDMNSINQSVLSVVFTGSMSGTIENPVPPYMTDATSGATLNFASNAPNMELACQFFWSPAVLVNQGAEFNTSPAPTVSVTIGDAILVGTPLPPVGALAVTERKDTCGGAPELSPYDDTGWIGWVPAYCTMATTDTKDYTGGAHAGPPFFGIGWEGFLPLFATFAITDQRDTMAGYGWYALGYDNIIGRMYPTEAPDRMAYSNYTGNGSCHGTWSSHEHKDRLGGNGFEVPKENPPAPRRRAVMIVT